MRLRLISLPLLAASLFLSACGFEPMNATHGTDSPTRALLPVEIAPVSAPERRVAQQFQMALEDLVDPALTRAAQPYRLTSGVGIQRTPVFIRQDGTIARYNLSLTVSYSLIRQEGNVSVAAGNLRYVNSYNVPDSDYAEYVAEQDATRRGLEQLAEDLRLRLAGFLARKPDAASQAPVNPALTPQAPLLPEAISIIPKVR